MKKSKTRKSEKTRARRARVLSALVFVVWDYGSDGFPVAVRQGRSSRSTTLVRPKLEKVLGLRPHAPGIKLYQNRKKSGHKGNSL